jgi:hypothetical protein
VIVRARLHCLVASLTFAVAPLTAQQTDDAIAPFLGCYQIRLAGDQQSNDSVLVPRWPVPTEFRLDAALRKDFRTPLPWRHVAPNPRGTGNRRRDFTGYWRLGGNDTVVVAWGNAAESYILKFLDASDTLRGDLSYTTDVLGLAPLVQSTKAWRAQCSAGLAPGG